MIKKILLVLVAALVAFVGYAATLPDDFTFSRSVTIKAAPQDIFPLINDQHRWLDWSPWAKLDPAMKTTFSGPAAGDGSVYEWEGNMEVGTGRSTIVESTFPTKVAFKLEFKQPFASTADASFTLAQQGEETTVTWAMASTRGLLMKVMGLVMNCEAMMGKQFDDGLASLKALAEKPQG